MWFQPLLMYLIAGLLQVLPLELLTIRLPMAMVGVANVVLVYFTALALFRRRLPAITAAVLLGTAPAHFLFSRSATDYLLPVPFILGWLWCLTQYRPDRTTVHVDRRRCVAGRWAIHANRRLHPDADLRAADLRRAVAEAITSVSLRCRGRGVLRARVTRRRLCAGAPGSHCRCDVALRARSPGHGRRRDGIHRDAALESRRLSLVLESRVARD